MDKVADSCGDNDGLIRGNLAEAFAVQVIEMGMGNEYKIDGGKVVVGEACVAETADDEKPVGPVGIDENISAWTLDQKRGVANPGDTDLSCFELRKDGGR